MRRYNGRSQILFTGGAGFLGSDLGERLPGHDVICGENCFATAAGAAGVAVPAAEVAR